MENASKALLIAGGVLITMIVASFGVYLYGVYHEHSENMLRAMSEKEISEFNAKFWAFEGKELTANEVVSIMNLVRNYNYDKSDDLKIDIGWGNSVGSTYNFNGRFNELKGFDEWNEEKYREKCNEFITEFSSVSKYTIIDESGTIRSEMNYDYVFSCKVKKYNDLTGFVKAIEIQGKNKK